VIGFESQNAVVEKNMAIFRAGLFSIWAAATLLMDILVSLAVIPQNPFNEGKGQSFVVCNAIGTYTVTGRTYSISWLKLVMA
jgi:hypothetical protein